MFIINNINIYNDNIVILLVISNSIIFFSFFTNTFFCVLFPVDTATHTTALSTEMTSGTSNVVAAADENGNMILGKQPYVLFVQ